MGKIVDTDLLIYRHWAIMASRENLFDIMALGGNVMFPAQKANIVFAL